MHKRNPFKTDSLVLVSYWDRHSGIAFPSAGCLPPSVSAAPFYSFGRQRMYLQVGVHRFLSGPDFWAGAPPAMFFPLILSLFSMTNSEDFHLLIVFSAAPFPSISLGAGTDALSGGFPCRQMPKGAIFILRSRHVCFFFLTTSTLPVCPAGVATSFNSHPFNCL